MDSPSFNNADAVAAMGFRAITEAVLRSARGSRHRRLIVLSGSEHWTRALADLALREQGGGDRLWVGDATGDYPVLASAKAHTLLGRELDLIVFDTRSGFDPDALGAVAGALRGGGLMFLLTPPLDCWPQFPDPQRARITVAPYGPEAVGGRFLARLARVIREDADALVLEQGQDMPSPAGFSTEQRVPAETAVQIEQQAAVAAVLRTAQGHRRRPVVLLADRGRGKSAAFGIAAAELLRETPRRIVITGPRLDAVEPAFRHAAERLPSARWTRGELRYGMATLRFVAPDELAAAPAEADLVLVDEAAAIPTPLLRRLLVHYPRIAFASTVHGYEGTGRGFTLRFHRELDSLTPGWRLLRLQAPIRWAEGDPLERFVSRALMLDADAARDDAVAVATPAEVAIQRLDRDELAADEGLLRELFGLLVLAHYRTRPFDLRHLLDGPNLSVWVARFGGHVAAAALVAAEGGLDADLGPAIRRGERRVRGHLIPQSLAAHLGVQVGPSLRCDRVMRVAVHPGCQQRGLGRALIAAIAERAILDGSDLIGSSFGGTPELLRFWAGLGVAPVRVGVSREAISGEHSVMVLRPLTSNGEEAFVAARSHFRDNLPYQLAEPLSDLNPVLVSELFRGVGPAASWRLNAQEHTQLTDFANGGRGYEDSLAVLWKLACLHLSARLGDAAVAPPASSLVIVKVLQRRDWQATAREFGLAGRGEVLAALRIEVAGLIEAAEGAKLFPAR